MEDFLTNNNLEEANCIKFPLFHPYFLEIGELLVCTNEVH